MLLLKQFCVIMSFIHFLFALINNVRIDVICSIINMQILITVTIRCSIYWPLITYLAEYCDGERNSTDISDMLGNQNRDIGISWTTKFEV